MRTRIIVVATLLALGAARPAGANPRPLPVPSVQETEPPPKSERQQKPVSPPVPPRGQMLYENHCTACHASVVHVRSRLKTRSLPELQARVRHWAEYLRLRWGKEEIEEVVVHLNTNYYHFKSR